MADLTPTTSGCCAPAIQEICCEHSAKQACCGASAGGTCGCSAGPAPPRRPEEHPHRPVGSLEHMRSYAGKRWPMTIPFPRSSVSTLL